MASSKVTLNALQILQSKGYKLSQDDLEAIAKAEESTTTTVAETKANQTSKAEEAIFNVTNTDDDDYDKNFSPDAYWYSSMANEDYDSDDYDYSYWEASTANEDDDNYDSGIDYTEFYKSSGTTDATKETLSSSSLAVTQTAAVEKAQTTKKVFSIDSQYNSTSGSRLATFEQTTGADDSARRAYFTLSGSTDAINLLKDSIKENSSLTAILEALTQEGHHFMNFVLTGLSENLQEKQALIQTIGDYYTATFSGMDPHIMAITGLLPFDASTSQSSWFINFINAYIHLIRASKLALYRLKLKLVIPDYCKNGYVCYPTSLMYNLSSNTDNLVNFSMNMIILEEELTQAWGISATAQQPETVTEKVKSSTSSKDTTTIGSTNIVSPSEIGETTKSKNFVDTLTSGINEIVSGATTTEVTKAINTVNKVVSCVSQVQGAVNIVNGVGQAFGSRLKIFNS